MVRRLVAVAPLLIFGAQGTAADATSLKDVNVAVRVLDFVSDPVQGSAPLGVVYNARNKASADDARAIVEWVGSDNGPRKTAWQPVLVDVKALFGTPGLRAVILADGTEGYYDLLYDYAKFAKTVTISADLGCVRANRCAVGVATVPRVEVILNQQVSAECGLQFSQGFRMMVTEY